MPGTSGFVRVTRYAGYLRTWWRSALRLAWWGGEGFSIDASLIRADVDKTKRVRLAISRSPGLGPRRRRVRFASTSLFPLDSAGNDEETGGDGGSNGGGTRGKPPKEISP